MRRSNKTKSKYGEYGYLKSGAKKAFFNSEFAKATKDMPKDIQTVVWRTMEDTLSTQDYVNMIMAGNKAEEEISKEDSLRDQARFLLEQAMSLNVIPEDMRDEIWDKINSELDIEQIRELIVSLTPEGFLKEHVNKPYYLSSDSEDRYSEEDECRECHPKYGYICPSCKEMNEYDKQQARELDRKDESYDRFLLRQYGY